MLKFFKKKDKNKKKNQDKELIDKNLPENNSSSNNLENQPTVDSQTPNPQITEHNIEQNIEKNIEQNIHDDMRTEFVKSELSKNIEARKEKAQATTLNHEDKHNKIAQAVEKSEQYSGMNKDESDPMQSSVEKKQSNHEAQTTQDPKINQDPQTNQATESQPQIAPIVKPNQKLDEKLEKSRNGFGKKMKHLFSFKKTIDEDLFEDIETTLLMADVGAKATMDIVDNTAKSVKRMKLSDNDAVYDALKIHLTELAKKVEKPLVVDTTKTPYVILVVGVNGVGKTTTIAKIARNLKQQGKSVMLAAGDTFRAAAVDQLKTWGEREDIPVVAQTTGSDSASVIFDAMSSAKAKGMDVLIADTAGRLHTQANLMQELGKIGRVMKKNDVTAPHETLIVVDGGTGQNAISQIQEFNKTTKLTGIAITKLDGTAKGGVLFNLAKEFGIPVRFIGVGEKSSDLKPFIAKEFVDALLG